MRELLEAGVHFGHQTRRWNPKMKRFIFTERGGIYIIDLQQTSELLQEAHDFARNLASRGGNMLLVTGLAFGTRGAFGPEEPRFRDFFGIETVFRGPNGSTNFALSLTDSVRAVVTPAVTQFHFLSFGLGAVMECFGSRQDAATRSLYFYPESTFVRGDSLTPFANTVQFDVGGLFREVFFSLGGCDNHAPDAPGCPSPSRGLRILFMQIQVIAIAGVAVGVVAGIVGRGWSGWVGMLAGAMLVGLFADGLGLLPAISQNAWLLFLFVGFVALTPGYAGARIVARAWRRRSGGTDASRVFRERGVSRRFLSPGPGPRRGDVPDIAVGSRASLCHRG